MAKRELKVHNSDKFLPFCLTPSRGKSKIAQIRSPFSGNEQKLSSRVTLLRRLVDSEWGADAKALHLAALYLFYSTGPYIFLNDALHIVTGCLLPNPTNHQVILSGIQRALRFELGVTLFMVYRRFLDFYYMLHEFLIGPQMITKRVYHVDVSLCQLHRIR